MREQPEDRLLQPVQSSFAEAFVLCQHVFRLQAVDLIVLPVQFPDFRVTDGKGWPVYFGGVVIQGNEQMRDRG